MSRAAGAARTGPFGSPAPGRQPLRLAHERARPQHRQLLPQVPGGRHRPRRDREERRPPAGPRRDRADRQRGARHAAGRGHARRCAAPRRCATTAPRSTTCCAGWSRPRPGVPGHRLARRHPRGRPPRRPRRREVHALGADHRRGGGPDRGLHRPGAAAQPGQPQGHLRRARAARPRRAAGGRVRHLVPLDDARGGLPVRDPLPALRAAQDPPLRLPRHLAPLRGATATGRSPGRRTRTRTSSRCTSATAARPARSRRASRSTPRWASRRSRAW